MRSSSRTKPCGSQRKWRSWKTCGQVGHSSNQGVERNVFVTRSPFTNCPAPVPPSESGPSVCSRSQRPPRAWRQVRSNGCCPAAARRPHSTASFASSPATPPLKPCRAVRSEEHTSELQSRVDLVCRLLLEKKKRYLS